MPVYKTYSQRQKELRGDLPDVYVYDGVPKTLRVQMVQIMRANVGERETDRGGDYTEARRAYGYAVEILRRELGVFYLPPRTQHHRDNYLEEITDYLLTVESTESFLDAIEIICRLIERVTSKYNYVGDSDAEEKSKAAILEVNERFKQHSLGFEYDGKIIRIDAELLHATTVKPALSLLRDPLYKGAQEEFVSAYAHYRQGENKEALTDALKSLESTMKIICTKRQWAFGATDTAKKLIDVCFGHNLIPQFWQSHFSSLRSMLESGVPTARNKTSGHGQGATPQSVPDHVAAYALHMTASTIVFLVNAEKTLP